MGRKIFVSYKYADDSVENLTSSENSTVRDYVSKFESKLDSSDHIFKGESDGEDLSNLSEETIWSKLKDRIYDSSLTIVFISPKMKDNNKTDRDQWIPWEISYSLKEESRKNKNGDPVTSKTNAMIAVVLPDENGSYNYYLEKRTCCSSGCTTHHTNTLFQILSDNKFNLKNANKKNCDNNSTIWYGDFSYVGAVRWNDFYSDCNKYIDKAYDRQNNLENYEITKTIK